MEKLLEMLSAICPGVDFENEENLIDDGLIDSFDLVSIASEMAETFGLELTVDDLVPENFNSAKAMMDFINKHL